MNEDRLKELHERETTLVHELGWENRKKRELEQVRNEIKAASQPVAEIEFYCVGRFLESTDRGRRYLTVVDTGEKLVDIPLGYQLSQHGEPSEAVPLTSAEIERAHQHGRIYLGGRLTPVSKDKARQLKQQGLTIEVKAGNPGIVNRTHHAAQV